ncbi:MULTISPECIES: LacI family DNA-binding transcriptional regulator [unclassified Nocardioides]|uniref:LacI family DNA-binding transcriptional regulator n=1 Tax=unclassified Nocardioides TaxID=2615069 RepID=UPI00361EBB7C
MPEGRVQDRPPSMADVAALAGVSHQTVSRVLNDASLVKPETRERVLEAIRQLGYRRNSAARSLATRRSGRIGMVSAHLSLHGPTMISAAVHGAANRLGYDVSMSALDEISPESLQQAVDRLLDQSVEALVVAVANRAALATTRALHLPIPVVIAQGVERGEPLAAGVDQEHGAVIAVRHLLDLGHTSVAHVTGPLEWVEGGERRAGWQAAHLERGLVPGPAEVGDWTAESGYRAGLALAENPAVTAVFAANDAMALGVLRALHERGRDVPGEISVVGFDDVPEAAYFWPALTTVNQAFSVLGTRALELAVRAIEGEEAPTADLVEPTLVVRRSTGRPRQV